MRILAAIGALAIVAGIGALVFFFGLVLLSASLAA